MAAYRQKKRRDAHNNVLRKGESLRKDGCYVFRFKGFDGKRHAIYSVDLKKLREREKGIAKDMFDGIKTESRYTTLNELYDIWKELKRWIKDSTFQNYKYLYETYVRNSIGKARIGNLTKSDIKRFYNYLFDERALAISTIEGVHIVLHQIFEIAVDDNYIRNNITDGAFTELKKARAYYTQKKHALTKEQAELFLNFMKNNCIYSHWYPIFAVMLGTGMRVGEVTGLRWSDIDLDKRVININHTLVYYCHRNTDSKNGCYFNVNTPKTPNSVRQIPMLDFVKEAFEMEAENQKELRLECEVMIDGYSDFIFINRFGNVQNQGTLNKAIKRIIRDCNDQEILKDSETENLLPDFSCHILRHTFATRMCEAGINLKVVQNILGHKDISTTLDIYIDVTENMTKKAVDELDKFFGNEEPVY